MSRTDRYHSARHTRSVTARVVGDGGRDVARVEELADQLVNIGFRRHAEARLDILLLLHGGLLLLHDGLLLRRLGVRGEVRRALRFMLILLGLPRGLLLNLRLLQREKRLALARAFLTDVLRNVRRAAAESDAALLQVSAGEVACSFVTVTEAQSGPSRLGGATGSRRTRLGPGCICVRPSLLILSMLDVCGDVWDDCLIETIA